MPSRPVTFPSYRAFHAILLTGVSALALLTAGMPARALQLATMRGGAGSASATASAAAAAIAAVQQAQTATQQSMSNLLRASQAVAAMQQTQAAARALARPSYISGVASVPNGVTPGGLQLAPGVLATSTTPADPSLWQNANLPVQSGAANGQITVTIKQTSQKAILTWQTFNVGSQTTVDFDQSGGNQTDGNNDWIALNRIIDPSGLPSQILGQIKAEGSVYLINANGIIFGGASQINVHTLIASSLSFLSDTITSSTPPGSIAYDNAVSTSNATFLNSSSGGIASPEATGGTGNPNGGGNAVLGIGGSAASAPPSGPIDIEAGASIATHANGAQSDGGFVLIAAQNVATKGRSRRRTVRRSSRPESASACCNLI